jgi:DNA-binding SARP family transcriptional activator
VRRRASLGALEGALVLAALGCVPVALVEVLHTPVVVGVEPMVDALVGAAAVAWVVVSVGLVRLVALHVRGSGAQSEPGLMGWAAVRVAALVLCVAPFLEHPATSRGATSATTPWATQAVDWLEPATGSLGEPVAEGFGSIGADGVSEVTRVVHGLGPRAPSRCRSGPVTPIPLGSGAVLVTLAADVRRRARLARRIVLDDEGAVDVETSLLAAPGPPTLLLTGAARALAAAGRLHDVAHVVLGDGEAWLDDESWRYDPAEPQRDVRCLLVTLGEERGRTHVVLVPRGATLELGGPAAPTLVDDAVRVGSGLGVGRPVRTGSDSLLQALALREDDEVVVCEGDPRGVAEPLRERCVHVVLDSAAPLAEVGSLDVRLRDGRVLERSTLAPSVRALLDGAHDRHVTGAGAVSSDEGDELEDRDVVVRLLTAVPRVDGLLSPLESGRERRAVELLAYLALRAGEPVTGERLRVRVLGTPSTDAAAKTLFNVASCLRRALGEGAFGPRLPAAGRSGHYVVAGDVRCDVALLHARAARARRCEDPEEQMAWLRAALELVESEPFATVLEGYDWFLSEGHVARLQAACEDAACELVELALSHGLVELAEFALERAVLVDPHAERLAVAAARVAAARQASFEAIAPAVRSTVPSAPAVA